MLKNTEIQQEKRPLATIKDNFPDLEKVDYNIDANINDLNDIVDIVVSKK